MTQTQPDTVDQAMIDGLWEAYERAHAQWMEASQKEGHAWCAWQEANASEREAWNSAGAAFEAWRKAVLSDLSGS